MLSLNRHKLLAHRRWKSSRLLIFFHRLLCFSHTKHHHDEEQFRYILDSIVRSDPNPIDTLDVTKLFHALTVTIGCEQPIFVSNKLVILYGTFGDIASACQVFDGMPEQNTASWNSIMKVYIQHGLGDEARQILSSMMSNGFMPNQFTLGSSLSLCCGSCASSSSLQHAMQLHGLMVKIALSDEVYAGTALMDVLMKHACLDDALKLFDELPQRNVVTWNVMISGLVEQGLSANAAILFRELLRCEGIGPSESSFVTMIGACRLMQGIKFGEQIHGLILKVGVISSVVVGNALVDMYAKHVIIGSSEKLFDEVAARDTISWNTMIVSCTDSGRFDKSLDLFLKMLAQGFRPNQTTLSILLSSCARLRNIACGMFIHGKAIKMNFELDDHVGSAIIALYGKCNFLTEALIAFHSMPEKTVVHWNAVLHGAKVEHTSSTAEFNTEHVDATLSLQELIREMMKLDVPPSGHTFSYIIRRLSMISLEDGPKFLSQIIRRGLDRNSYVCSALIAMFAERGVISDAYSLASGTSFYPSSIPWNVIAGNISKLGAHHEAYLLVSQLKDPDIVSWNIAIAACSRSWNFREAFECFHRMQNEGIQPDNYTFASLLSICTGLCNLGVGQAIHCLMLKMNLDRCDILVHNLLMNMYAKCGSLDSCMGVLNGAPLRNVVTWTILISACGLYGHSTEAIRIFYEMWSQGIQPDHVTFAAILSACKHAKLVEQGLFLFRNMKGVYGVEPTLDHFECMLELLWKSGNIEEAQEVIRSMPFEPSPAIWRSFLSSSRG